MTRRRRTDFSALARAGAHRRSRGAGAAPAGRGRATILTSWIPGGQSLDAAAACDPRASRRPSICCWRSGANPRLAVNGLGPLLMAVGTGGCRDRPPSPRGRAPIRGVTDRIFLGAGSLRRGPERLERSATRALQHRCGQGGSSAAGAEDLRVPRGPARPRFAMIFAAAATTAATSCRVGRATRSRISRLLSSPGARSTSATLHAWAMQPRGVYGASASKISLIEPTHASLRCASKPVEQLRAPRRDRRDAACSHASTNGPISQAHTVPWW